MIRVFLHFCEAVGILHFQRQSTAEGMEVHAGRCGEKGIPEGCILPVGKGDPYLSFTP